MQKPDNQKGFILLITTFFMLMIMITVSLSMSALMFNRQMIITNSVKSTQSYYAAESGIEDSLLKLKNNPQIPATSYAFTVGNTTANVTIPAIAGGSRQLLAKGDNGGIIKNIGALYTIDSQGIAFHYGAQAGEGGVQMSNLSVVKGNVFSSGSITGSGTIENEAIVAGQNSINGVDVNGNAISYSCVNADIGGNLTYVAGGSNTCDVEGSTTQQSGAVPVQPLPISQEQIDEWKNGAQEVEVISGNYTIANNQTQAMGPVKITGNLILANNATLRLMGTVYVVGSITISNNAKIQLDASYGSLGGVLLADGLINISNNSVFSGSGQAGSYVLMLSTSTSNSAIVVSNNGGGAIFYTSQGGVLLNNNVKVKEVTGYKITMNNNVIVEYESGLANPFFSGGPGGAWKVTNWEEK